MRVVLVLMLAACGFSVRTGGAIDAAPPPEGIDAPPDMMVDMVTPPNCRAVEIESMSAQNCVRRNDGEVWCWGRNADGAVGVPSPVATCQAGNPCVRVPTKVAFPEAIVKLGLGDRHSCAMSATKTYCWGFNANGQYGDGTITSATSPREIAARAGATLLRGGDLHTCSSNGVTVACSGKNAFAELGDTTQMQRESPVTPVLPGTPSTIGAGYHHSCAISSGVVHCWGANESGQVFGAGNPVGTPRAVVGVMNATAVAGGFAHTCARISDGSLRCWGSNTNGQLGNGNTMPQPGIVTLSLTGVTQIVAGSDHTCALAGTGVWCWGEGYPAGPTQINFSGAPAIAVSAGSYHDCAILMDGTVRCWGSNGYGQLGNDSLASSATPVEAVVCP